LLATLVTVAGSRFQRFEIGVSGQQLHDLSARVRQARLPAGVPGQPWALGTDRDYLRELLEYWAGSFDWRTQEARLNGFAHYRGNIDGIQLHFVHERARHGGGIPLILGHGWPSAFVEYLPVIPLLTDPGAHGIDGPEFDVVIPSLPGYGFSTRPGRAVTYRDVAKL
jgi:hypothetical protein